MVILYKEEYEQIDVYCFQINQGGNFQIKLEGSPHQQEVKLIFVNGEFARSDLPFSPPFDRSHWHILGAIAQKIDEIEANHEAKHNPRAAKPLLPSEVTFEPYR